MKNEGMTLLFAALMLCMGVFFSPVTAYARTDEDVTPPTVTAEVRGATLHIEAVDEHSGVEAVYVDNHKITSLTNGVVDVVLKDYAGNGAKVSIYAVDHSGNRSGAVQVDNPYYQAPVPLTPPAASSPASSSNTGTGTAAGSESSLPADAASNPFTPDGTGTVQDTATDEDGKEFYTITTPDGYVYYLVIDNQRDSDNVYFLNAVTEEDLLGLAGTAASEGESALPAESVPQPEPEPEPAEPDEPEPEQETGSGVGAIIFIVLATIAVVGAGWYFKIYKPKQEAALEDEDEFDIEEDEGDEGEDELLDEAEDYDFDEDEAEAYRASDGTESEDE